MDQHPGAGHHILTTQAVHDFFSGLAPGATVLGVDEKGFAAQLDHGQGYADGHPLGSLVPGHVERWMGDTYLPSARAPEAQARHAVADSAKSAADNIAAIKEVIVSQMLAANAAHANGDTKAEFLHLGAAVHCLQDSYSSAHMFRDPSDPSNPQAPIQAINSFAFVDSFHYGATHEGKFDEVEVTDGRVERLSDRAAVPAVRTLLETYMHSLDATMGSDLRTVFGNGVDPFLQGPDAVVFQHSHQYIPGLAGPIATPFIDPAFGAQLHAHEANEVSAPDGTLMGSGQGAPAPVLQSIDPSSTGFTAAVQSSDPPSMQHPSTTGEVHPMTMNGEADASTAHNASAPADAVQSVQPDPAVAAAPQAPHGDGSAPVADAGRIVHPTGGVHTDVRTVRDESGHRHLEYGQGGSTGQTAHEHATNPKQPDNWESRHGADIVCPPGTPVYAAFDGKVGHKFGVEHGHEQDGTDSSHHGNRMTIVGDTNQAYYQHLSQFAPGVAAGSQVHAGQLIGYSGTGGGVDHLHVAFLHGDTDQLLHHAVLVHDVTTPGPEPTHASNGEARPDAGQPASHHMSAGLQHAPANGRFFVAADYERIAHLESLNVVPGLLLHQAGNDAAAGAIVIDPGSSGPADAGVLSMQAVEHPGLPPSMIDPGAIASVHPDGGAPLAEAGTAHVPPVDHSVLPITIDPGSDGSAAAATWHAAPAQVQVPDPGPDHHASVLDPSVLDPSGMHAGAAAGGADTHAAMVQIDPGSTNDPSHGADAAAAMPVDTPHSHAGAPDASAAAASAAVSSAAHHGPDMDAAASVA